MTLPTRHEVEDFLIHEADLIDTWKLNEWAQLFDDQGEYQLPPTDCPNGEPEVELFLIYDDKFRLEQRAVRQLKKTEHSEYPRSRVTHIVSNVQVREGEDDYFVVICNVVVHRSRLEKHDIFPCRCEYRMLREGDSFKIRRKRVILGMETLRNEGKLSIII